ncbi:hypothetical protein KCP77_07915 [Salmonella enterica subsp. enterica]|nr:hypothetical protein KCP77_07915 [Salmonella enterica subsp. enterica]
MQITQVHENHYIKWAGVAGIRALDRVIVKTGIAKYGAAVLKFCSLFDSLNVCNSLRQLWLSTTCGR